MEYFGPFGLYKGVSEIKFHKPLHTKDKFLKYQLASLTANSIQEHL